mgnify:CR=1 FL=1
MSTSVQADKDKIFGAVKEISASLTRIEAERSLIKEIVGEFSKQYQIPRKQINKIARTYHKQNRTSVEEEHEEFTTLYDTIVK